MKRQLKDLSQFKFISTDSKILNLGEFLESEDYWSKEAYRTKEGKREKTVIGIFLKHSAIQRLAKEAGVQVNNVSMLVSPLASNEQQHLYGGEFNGGFLVSENIPDANNTTETSLTFKPIVTSTFEVGEASSRNCESGVSRKYMGSIGFKRFFDRGVLAHLGFYELYSEEEAEEFNQDEVAAKMTSKDFDAIKDILNGFANAVSIQALDEIKAIAVAQKEVFSRFRAVCDRTRPYVRRSSTKPHPNYP
jgi:hypothetical protein